jgi:hypothetical protein
MRKEDNVDARTRLYAQPGPPITIKKNKHCSNSERMQTPNEERGLLAGFLSMHRGEHTDLGGVWFVFSPYILFHFSYKIIKYRN